jgi:hypothetical protein
MRIESSPYPHLQATLVFGEVKALAETAADRWQFSLSAGKP